MYCGCQSNSKSCVLIVSIIKVRATCTPTSGSFPKLGVPYFGVLGIRILQFTVLYKGPLFSETPISVFQ